MITIEAEHHYREVPLWPYVLRRVVSFATTPLLKKEVLRQPGDGLSKVGQLIQEGYGSVLIFNHLSKGEIPRILTLVAESPLGRREMFIPEAFHQYHGWQGPAGRLVRITVSPIITSDSLDYIKKHPKMKDEYEQTLTRAGLDYIIKHPEMEDKYKQRPMKVGKIALFEDCLTREVSTLNEGGIVLMFIQGGRRPYLETVTRAVSELINRSSATGVNRYTLMAVGVGIKDVENYADGEIRGYNLWRQYQFTMGRALTSTEFQTEAKQRGLTLDQLALEELKLVVPPSYLPRR